eukprot:5809034-Prymnesium_polylepis.1
MMQPILVRRFVWTTPLNRLELLRRRGTIGINKFEALLFRARIRFVSSWSYRACAVCSVCGVSVCAVRRPAPWPAGAYLNFLIHLLLVQPARLGTKHVFRFPHRQISMPKFRN